VARLERERKKLEKNLSGIREMSTLPDALFVIDTRREAIAIHEARRLGIPIIGVADTNCDPDSIDYIIPGNDDALRAIQLIAVTIADSYLEGKALYEAQQRELAEQMEKQRQAQAQLAREASARRAAEAREAADAAAGSEGAAAAGAAGEGAARPKTTVRRTLQRKAKPRRAEGEALGGAGEGIPTPAAAGASEPDLQEAAPSAAAGGPEPEATQAEAPALAPEPEPGSN
jgi:hypothetical protein